MGVLEGSNLFRYYLRLVSYPVNEECKVVLADVAEQLFTSPRHARTLLKQMTEFGWVRWLPKAGRNQRSVLVRVLDVDVVKKQIAKRWMVDGKYEKALDFLDRDQVLFGSLLQQLSGASFKEGRVNVQLTYDRPFKRLLPHYSHRNSERFLIRQLYSCLVSMDHAGDVKPDLAHYWESDPGYQTWTFYLRPSLYFDNGEEITASGVAKLVRHLAKRPHYRHELDHLLSVEAVHGLKIVVTLSRPDRGFSALLSDLKYSIQPSEQLNDAWDLENQVTGSGIFELKEHTEHKVVLVANERYYSARALTDEVTIWLLNKAASHTKSSACEHAITSEKVLGANDSNLGNDGPLIDVHSNSLLDNAVPDMVSLRPDKRVASYQESQIRIEDGCLFILFNRRKSQLRLNAEQRKWLSECLNGDVIWQDLSENNVTFGAQVAKNFFPFWHPVQRLNASPVSLPDSLSIVVYDHPGLVRCSKAIQRLLANLDVTTSVTVMPHEAFLSQATAKAFDYDLILSNVNLDDNRHVSALLAFTSDPVIQAAMDDESMLWLRDQIKAIRERIEAKDYLDYLEPICSALIYEGLVSPMFHHRQTLSFHDVIKGVAMTTWGWPQLREVWSDD
ncbi:hypothetical protein BCU70_01215 [Vibrio sp. 10N.286.49.C2]|uniref:ABC transporter substrate-binding protein n=1 Tax=unclassified Vibrio TaxID=2614977 RepID=UPI000CBA9C07|nr:MULTISPECIES: ABC transporter substrate-binding protein [unclassified Vibrio]PMH42810.1 hypothetical protein BCU70_01215 [Vibrio sp. 10N.286.49.C2]PMH53851.1 hypothetical protein BCU66_13620 [Vibrio sp. 10N.286.49.B1]PMH81610.1 hypothetical protein BCU58_20930 [Vibrio sp. 10N.286.48.B7]